MISIKESRNIFHIIRHLLSILKDVHIGWIAEILLIWIVDYNQFKFFAILKDDKFIAGFYLTQLPVTRFKPSNWFKYDVSAQIKQLQEQNYFYLSCLIILKTFRNQNIGTFILKYLNENKVPIWFHPTKRATSFYLNNGAEVVCTQSGYVFYKIANE